MLRLLYQDEHYIAVYKPSGLLVHRSMIDRHETQFALQMARDLIGQRVYPVHRLDKPTSGVLLFALSSQAANRLMTRFADGEIDKEYLAVVRGYTEESGVIDYALVEERDRIADAMSDPNPAPQNAITHYSRLATVEFEHPVGRYSTARFSLVRVSPKTGRRHQIRRHLRHIFHPVLCDTTHGDGKQNRFFKNHLGADRLMLSATRVSFMHPYSKQRTTVDAFPDERFTRVTGACSWDLASLLDTATTTG